MSLVVPGAQEEDAPPSLNLQALAYSLESPCTD